MPTDAAPEPDGGRVAAIVVTYRPDLEELRTVLRSALGEVDRLLVIDNSPKEAAPGVASCLESVVREAGGPDAGNRVRLTAPGSNIGLARAYNLGIRDALEQRVRYILFLDQDSVVPPGAVARLRGVLDPPDRADPVGAASGRNLDRVAARLPTDRFLERWRSGRVARPAGLDRGDGSVAQELFTNSGTMVPTARFEQVGGFDEQLFLDAVDYEFSLRLRAAGFSLRLVPGVTVDHRQGAQFRRQILGRTVELRSYSAERTFHIVHDTLRFARRWRRRFPRVVGGIVATMTLTTAAGLVVLPDRGDRVRAVFRALGEVGRGR